MGVGETFPIVQTPITRQFLENILKRKISSFKTTEGSNPGDNYTSIVISLEIVFEDGEAPLHFIYKTFPHQPIRQKYLEGVNFFLKEYQMYNVWIEELVNFQKFIPGHEKTLVPAMPKLVAGAAIDYLNGDPKNGKDVNPLLSNFLLMVDVRKTYGFKLADKLNSLGYYHVKLVMEELAKFHALGYAYKQHKKLSTLRSRFPFIKDAFYNNPMHRVTLEAMLKSNIQMVMNACKDYLEERPEIAESLNKLKDPMVATDYMTMFIEPEGMDEEKVESFMRIKLQGSPLKEQWIVAGHGDCWTNNILFKNDEKGNVSETILVDLQLSRESCIMADLVFFLYTSTDTNFRKQYLDKMLSLYHERFVHFCKILKVDPFPGFTLENFQRKYNRSKIVGLLFACLILPLTLQRPESTINFDNCVTNGSEDSGKNVEDAVAEMMHNIGRDKDDDKMLRDRMTAMMSELYEEGVI